MSLKDLSSSLCFRNANHFRAVQFSLVNFVNPGESVANFDGARWADILPEVKTSSLDNKADRERLMRATASLDLKWALLALPPFSKKESRDLLLRDPCVSIGESSIPNAGLGVFAARDIPALSLVTEYCGKTLVGDEADSLSAIDEQQLIWEEVNKLNLTTQVEHSTAMKEANRKINGFEADDDLLFGTGQGGRRSVLILGKMYDFGDEPGMVGSIVNDGAMIQPLDIESSSAEISKIVSDYQGKAGVRANLALVPKEDGLFLTTTKDVMKGDELFFPYGSSFWLAHRREEMLDELACMMHRGLAETPSGDIDLNQDFAAHVKQTFSNIEVASNSLLHQERMMMGATGGMERAGLQPIPPIVNVPQGEMLAAKMRERIARLTIKVSEPGASIAAGLLNVSPRDAAERMKAKFG
ncbi:hypothetical protein TrVE_jg8820 [Triparma verrucosa]|uniref:SET domain-containing protein n=1 Tax=Triparma verrucosa TaxID=1606542 RepID=A0A9W7FC53_9STRA|nr:hypothetical protein TrVE_jg8820 [Triparma verrucosa]